MRLEGVVFVVADDGSVLGTLQDPEVQFQRGEGGDLTGGVGAKLFVEMSTYEGEQLEASGTANGAGIEEDFERWLAHHAEVTGMRTPKKTTAIFKRVRKSYLSRRDEGFEADELLLAVDGAFADSYRREHGYYDHISVLRPTMVHKLAEKGRLTKAGRMGKAGDATTLAGREAIIKADAEGLEERTRRGIICGHVVTILMPPQPGEMDPFTRQPVEQPDEARRALEAMGLDVEATIAEYRDEALAPYRQMQQRQRRAA